MIRFVAVMFLAACGTTSEPPVAEPAPASVEPVAAAQSVAVDFTNAEGKLVCPVMGDVIESHAAAVGHTEHDGKTYWFCCDSCQHVFADDPERYADGKHLAHLQAEHDGKFWDCKHVM